MYLLPWLSIWSEKGYNGAVYNVPSILVEVMEGERIQRSSSVNVPSTLVEYMEGERIQRSSVQLTFCPGCVDGGRKNTNEQCTMYLLPCFRLWILILIIYYQDRNSEKSTF